jgi:hypothetical protein
LADKSEELFLQEISIYKKEKKMPYVTNAERIGEKRGLDNELVKKLLKNEITDIPLHLLDNQDNS